MVNALIENAQRLPQELYQSLTWDRGKEIAAHKRFTLATDILVYFCDLQNPWQRGANENTNGLLRQYFPKGSVLTRESCEQRRVERLRRDSFDDTQREHGATGFHLQRPPETKIVGSN